MLPSAAHATMGVIAMNGNKKIVGVKLDWVFMILLCRKKGRDEPALCGTSYGLIDIFLRIPDIEFSRRCDETWVFDDRFHFACLVIHDDDSRLLRLTSPQ